MSKLTAANELASIAVKASVAAALLISIGVGAIAYDKYFIDHAVCDNHTASFQGWINQDFEKRKTLPRGKIVSVYDGSLNFKQGFTTCGGSYRDSDGSYKKWSGSFETLTDGSIIGNASVE
jgi:hypothetical protein